MSLLLEITIISAQELSKPPSPSSASIRNHLRPYALLSLPPFPRLRTRVDPTNDSGNNPTWNDRFVFLLPSPDPLSPSSSTSLSLSLLSKSPLPLLLPDAPLGSVRVLLSSLNLLSRPLDHPLFSAFGIRRRSGRVKGVLNLGFTLLSRVSQRTRDALDVHGAVGYMDLMGERPRPALREVNSEADLQLCGFGGMKRGGKMSMSASEENLRRVHVSASDENLLCRRDEDDDDD